MDKETKNELMGIVGIIIMTMVFCVFYVLIMKAKGLM